MGNLEGSQVNLWPFLVFKIEQIKFQSSIRRFSDFCANLRTMPMVTIQVWKARRAICGARIAIVAARFGQSCGVD